MRWQGESAITVNASSTRQVDALNGAQTSTHFGGNAEYLTALLAHVDVLLARAVSRLHQQQRDVLRFQLSPHVITRDEVMHLLSLGSDVDHECPDDEGILCEQLEETQAYIDAVIDEAGIRGEVLPMQRLVRHFCLNDAEILAVIFCLAPELRRKYDRIYAYLQDDITRKRPSVDLLLSLIGEDEYERWALRPLFGPGGTLRQQHILQGNHDNGSPSGSSGLANFLSLDSRVLNFLLGEVRTADGLVDEVLGSALRFQPQCQQPRYGEASHSCERVRTALEPMRPGTLLHIHGPSTEDCLHYASAALHGRGQAHLVIHCHQLASLEIPLYPALRRCFRESRLQCLPLVFVDSEALFSSDNPDVALIELFLEAVASNTTFTLSCGHQALPLTPAANRLGNRSLALPLPSVGEREVLWRYCLSTVISEDNLVSLASHYELSAHQIARISADFLADAARQDGELASQRRLEDLRQRCRAQSCHKLHQLAVQVPHHYEWQDLVLPEEKIAVLQSICQQVAYQQRVFEHWGFGGKWAYGRGLSVLFAGSSGTGKTMTAQVMAKALSLDLFKIDLSGVVSKYIGETEKNLSKIFQQAESSNAILFFDEADALFGKRTEVSDAHDRYANIEVSYLLQRMEEYRGIVILATNFRNNMDEAFTRRLRFIVEFPFPDADSRSLIWQKSVPQQAPLAGDVDFVWLAKKLKLSGGNIKNSALNAAFLAAHEGSEIAMRHFLEAAKGEFEKMGKLWDAQMMAPPPHPAHATTSKQTQQHQSRVGAEYD